MATLTPIIGAKNNESLALVFVHGLGGHDHQTWMYDPKNKETLWPTWLAEDTGCATWTVGYDAGLSAWRESAMPLPDQGNTLIDRLASKPELKGQPLVLIGHSLGGLVIKAAIVQGMTQGVPRHQTLIERVRGVVFLATPHSGSHLASLARVVKVLLRTNDQVGDLSAHNAHLRSLHQQFLAQHKRLQFQVRTYRESRGVVLGKRWFGLFDGPRVMVVDPASAEPHVPDEVAVDLPEDHFSICKPKSRNEQVHDGLVEFIRQLPWSVPAAISQESPVSHAAPPISGKQQPPLQLPNRALAGKLFGRATLLSQLVDRLKRREHIDIWGPAGMGKTALAAEAIFQVMGNSPSNLAASPFPDGVVLLDLYRLKFASPDPAWHHLANSFEDSVPTTIPARDRATQACRGRRALVIVEGAEEAGDGTQLQELLSVLSPEIVRLVLTRNKAQVSTAKPFDVEAELTRDEAFALLREIWDKKPDESIIATIYRRFGGHPLALTWVGSQLNAGDESPKIFVEALNTASLPAINEPGYQKHTLHWLFQRSVSRLTPEARRMLAAAGLLAQQAFPLAVARAVLPNASEVEAREALKQLVRYGLLRVGIGDDECWEFTHALAHQFAHAETDETLLIPLGSWAMAAFDQAVAVAKITGNFAPLSQSLAHASALLRADHNAESLEALAEKLRYDGDDTLRALGRLDLVRTANAVDSTWLRSAQDDKLMTLRWQRDLSVSYDNLGDVEVAAGKLDAAREAYERSLAIAERLAEADPSNSGWQRDLSVSYRKIGDAMAKQNQRAEALEFLQKGLAISERLEKLDPSNAIWRGDSVWVKETIAKLK